MILLLQGRVCNEDASSSSGSEPRDKDAAQTESAGYFKLIAADLRMELASLREGWQYVLTSENR